MELFEFAARGIREQAAVNRLCRTDGPQTSKDAATKMVKSGKLNRQEKIVIRGIQHYLIGSHRENFTAKELANWMLGDTPKNYYMIQRRLSGLRKKGKIELIWIGYDDNNSRNIYKRRDSCRVWKLK